MHYNCLTMKQVDSVVWNYLGFNCKMTIFDILKIHNVIVFEYLVYVKPAQNWITFSFCFIFLNMAHYPAQHNFGGETR